MTIGRVAIFGGTGFIGHHLVPRLLQGGATVRVVARHPDRPHGATVSGAGLETIQADVLDDIAVRDATTGADAVINLVGIVTETPGQTYRALHVESARRIALAAKRQGAARLLHISALGASRDSPANADRTKAEGELAVREIFPEATIVRPSLVFGEDDHFFNSFAAMARRSPVLPLIGGGTTKFQPVAIADMVAGLLQVLSRSDTAGKTYEFGGPEVYSFRELLELMLLTLGWRRILLPIPFALAEIQAAMLELLPSSR
jgi:NADH dehydrogenase